MSPRIFRASSTTSTIAVAYIPRWATSARNSSRIATPAYGQIRSLTPVRLEGPTPQLADFDLLFLRSAGEAAAMGFVLRGSSLKALEQPALIKRSRKAARSVLRSWATDRSAIGSAKITFIR